MSRCRNNAANSSNLLTAAGLMVQISTDLSGRTFSLSESHKFDHLKYRFCGFWSTNCSRIVFFLNNCTWNSVFLTFLSPEKLKWKVKTTLIPALSRDSVQETQTQQHFQADFTYLWLSIFCRHFSIFYTQSPNLWRHEDHKCDFTKLADSSSCCRCLIID